MKNLTIATLAATVSTALVAAAPAAASNGATLTAAVAASAQANSNQQQQADASKKYCIKLEAITGSRLNLRQCRTKAEWEAIGVDVSAAK